MKHKVYIDICVVTRDKRPKVLKELWGLLWAGEGLAEEVAQRKDKIWMAVKRTNSAQVVGACEECWLILIGVEEV